MTKCNGLPEQYLSWHTKAEALARTLVEFGCDGVEVLFPAGHTCPERTPALPKDIGTMWRAVPGGTGAGTVWETRLRSVCLGR